MRLLLLSLGVAVAVSGAFAAGSGKFQDPLDAAAPSTRFTATTHLTAIARAGNRLVSVGVRGLIVLSDDEGKTWRQAPAPVSSDLVSVRFVTPSRGWACGHDGVILATSDGGEHWVKQLDGRMARNGAATPDEVVPAAAYLEALARRGLEVTESALPV